MILHNIDSQLMEAPEIQEMEASVEEMQAKDRDVDEKKDENQSEGGDQAIASEHPAPKPHVASSQDVPETTSPTSPAKLDQDVPLIEPIPPSPASPLHKRKRASRGHQ